MPNQVPVQDPRPWIEKKLALEASGQEKGPIIRVVTGKDFNACPDAIEDFKLSPETII